MEIHFPEVITYIGLCRSADTRSWDAETAYAQVTVPSLMKGVGRR